MLTVSKPKAYQPVRFDVNKPLAPGGGTNPNIMHQNTSHAFAMEHRPAGKAASTRKYHSFSVSGVLYENFPAKIMVAFSQRIRLSMCDFFVS